MTTESKEQLELAFLRLQDSNYKALAQLVVETLAAQKLYFKTRDKEHLMASLKLEKQLGDRAIAALKGN